MTADFELLVLGFFALILSKLDDGRWSTVWAIAAIAMFVGSLYVGIRDRHS